MQRYDTKIKDVFQQKKENNVNFIMRSQIKARSMKSNKQSQIFQDKSITPIQSTLIINDSLKKLDNNILSSKTIPGNSFWSIHSDVISNKVSSLPVVIIPNFLINNSFYVELLHNNDSFVNIVNDWTVSKKDVIISNNTLSKNDNNISLLIPSVPVNVSTKNDSVKHRFLTNNKDVGIPNKKNMSAYPKK